MSSSAVADEARDHPAVEGPARVGFALYGVVYLVLAWLTFQLALGDRPDRVSGKGALHQLAERPLGGTFLWLAAAGFAALVVWDGFRTFSRGRDLLGRVSSVCRGGVFALFAFLSAQVALTRENEEDTRAWTAQLLGLPFGRWLVGAVGAGTIAFGVYSITKAFGDRWRHEIDLEGRTGFSGRALAALVRSGYLTRGVAIGIVGGLFCWAAWTHDPGKSGGLDQALSRLRVAPYGPWLLVAVAVGFACWGAFQLAKARYLRTEG